MNIPQQDGSAGDVDYGRVGNIYSHYRQPDPHIAAFIHAALGSAKTVLNVGAGAGSYEPVNQDVTAVEPSAAMRAQRPSHLPVAINAIAENLPFEADAFDASMATFSVHQWADLAAGLKEMRRVTKGPVLILTCAPRELHNFWLNDYAPEVIATEAARYPEPDAVAEQLGVHSVIRPVPIPLHCKDGFNEAYYGRPEELLAPSARQACSAWSFTSPEATGRFQSRLENDLKNGSWDEKYSALRTQPVFNGSLKLIVGLR